jgi:Bacterial PH domain
MDNWRVISTDTTLRFRRSGALVAAAVMGVVCTLPVVFGPDLYAQQSPDGPAGSTVRWFLLPILLIPILFGAWAWRSGTDADREGIRVRALLGQRRIRWQQVSELTADRRGRAQARLSDGQAVALPAVHRADLPRLVAASGQQLTR